jgi:parvulin-like peptidyl-prolyl isomerase
MRKRILIASVALVLGACQKGGTASAKNGKFKAPEGDTTEIVAGVDTFAVTKGMVNRALVPSLGQIAQQAQYMGGDIDLVLKDARQKVTAQILLQHLISVEVAKKHVQAPQAKVDSVYAQFRKQFPTDSAYGEFLKRNNQTEAGVKEKLAEQVKADVLLETALADSLKVTDDEVQAYFEANKAQFGVGTQVKAAHILKLTKSPTDTAEAYAAILAVQKQLNAGNFSAIATKESQDPQSAQKGGDLGWFDPKDMVPEFSAALEKLKPGEISGIVRSQYGYHIIKLEERKEGHEPKMDTLKPKIVEQIQGMRKGQLAEDFMRALLKRAGVTFLNNDYRSVEVFGADKSAAKEGKQPGLITKMKKK